MKLVVVGGLLVIALALFLAGVFLGATPASARCQAAGLACGTAAALVDRAPIP